MFTKSLSLEAIFLCGGNATLSFSSHSFQVTGVVVWQSYQDFAFPLRRAMVENMVIVHFNYFWNFRVFSG
jgi:hypothetical protein